MMDRHRMLQDLEFGSQVAEDEFERIKSYFVETEHWRALARDRVDIVYGYKGAGKSALYLLLNEHSDTFESDGIQIVPAENPRGDTVFSNIKSNPPPDERAFINLWKIYFITVAVNALRGEIQNNKIGNIDNALTEAKLLPKEGRGTLAELFSAARRYLQPTSVEGGVAVDAHTGIYLPHAKIFFKSPVSTWRRKAT